MDAILGLIAVMVALVMVLWVTALAVRAMWRGDGVWKTLKSWFGRVVEALLS